MARISFVQRDVVSTNPSRPYQAQIIIQTTQTIDNPAFVLIGDESTKIDDASFFVTGEPAMMNVETSYKPGGPTFAIKFASPPLSPDAPLVVTLRSKTKVRIVKVEDAR